jgi:hypothetical protein
MDCIKEKRFLFWKFKIIEHDFKVLRVNKFMFASTTFHVHSECRVCKITKTEKFVTKDELIWLGIPVSEIEKITDSKMYHVNP